jgi:hypothetical protein
MCTRGKKILETLRNLGIEFVCVGYIEELELAKLNVRPFA